MYQDQNTYGTQGNLGDNMNQQFFEGTPVYDAGGDKVGTVSEHGVQDGSLVIHHGLFRQDVYVPLSTIQRNDADGVYLNVYKDDLLNQDMGAPAMNDTMTGTALDETNRVTTGTTGATMNATDVSTEDVRVPVREEELVVGKQQEELGRVHLHKDVVEEQETLTAPVTREEVRVERVPVQGQDIGADADAFEEQDIDVPVMGEELVTGKRAVVKEEVRLQKDAITENQQVSDTVRKERVTLDGADVTDNVDTQMTGVRARDMDTTIDNTTTNVNRP